MRIGAVHAEIGEGGRDTLLVSSGIAREGNTKTLPWKGGRIGFFLSYFCRSAALLFGYEIKLGFMYEEDNDVSYIVTASPKKRPEEMSRPTNTPWKKSVCITVNTQMTTGHPFNVCTSVRDDFSRVRLFVLVCNSAVSKSDDEGQRVLHFSLSMRL